MSTLSYLYIISNGAVSTDKGPKWPKGSKRGFYPFASWAPLCPFNPFLPFSVFSFQLKICYYRHYANNCTVGCKPYQFTAFNDVYHILARKATYDKGREEARNE